MVTRNRHLFRGLFYGWIIVGVFFIVQVIIYGIRYAFSVFYLSILKEFGWTHAATAGIFSINIIVYGLMAILSGRLADKFDPRKIVPIGTFFITLGMIMCSFASEIWQFYILFGVIISIGTCISGSTQFIPILARWFLKRRGAALGVVGAGGSIAFLISPFAEFLILNLGWRGAFMVLGALPTIIIVPLTVLFVKRRPEDKGLLPDGDFLPSSISISSVNLENSSSGSNFDAEHSSVEWTLNKAIRTKRFWMVFFAFFCIFGLGLNMIMAHQAAFIHDIGYSEVFAASTIGLYGVLSAVGNFSGFISDKLGRRTTFTIGVIGVIAAMFLLITTREATSPWKIYIYVLLFGFSMGLNSPTLSAISQDLYHGRNYGAINGLLMLGFGTGGSLGPWMAGYIFDTTGTYLPVFFIVILAFIIACILVQVAASSGR